MEWLKDMLPTLIEVSGWGQIVLILGSLGIPAVLGWNEKLKPVDSVLVRQMFWVYSGYIWATNLSFGVISAFAAPALLDGSLLASCVTGFIFVYWCARMVIQWTYFDISELPNTASHTAARWLLEVLFAGLTLTYGAAVAQNLGLL